MSEIDPAVTQVQDLAALWVCTILAPSDFLPHLWTH
jgi:hypothetical protein